jgi:hypothetical protein
MMDILGDSHMISSGHEDYQLGTRFEGFVHRTFNSEDFLNIYKSVKTYIHQQRWSTTIFIEHQTDTSNPAIHALNEAFFEIPICRTRKHVADQTKVRLQEN